MAPVACLAENAEKCVRKDFCQTIELWEGLYDVINNYLDSKTIADLMK